MRAAFFRMGGRNLRLDRARLGMPPAEQRFETGNPAVGQPHDRLVVDLDLAAFETLAQSGLEPTASRNAGACVLPE
jgi:hypothetical protein